MTHTKIGCEAYIVRDDKILLGKRGEKANGPWPGTWALPGGHLELYERIDDCIVREVLEELDIKITPTDTDLIAVTDDIEPASGDHYIHLTYSVNIGPQQPRLNEPDMCEKWQWFPLDKLPENLFPPHIKIFKTLESRKTYKSA